MKPLDSFLQKNTPKKRKSKLEPFKKEIFELFHKDFRVEQIQDFLKKQGVIVGCRAIYKFLKSEKKSQKNLYQTNQKIAQNKKTISKSEFAKDPFAKIKEEAKGLSLKERIGNLELTKQMNLQPE